MPVDRHKWPPAMEPCDVWQQTYAVTQMSIRRTGGLIHQPELMLVQTQQLDGLVDPFLNPDFVLAVLPSSAELYIYSYM